MREFLLTKANPFYKKITIANIKFEDYPVVLRTPALTEVLYKGQL